MVTVIDIVDSEIVPNEDNNIYWKNKCKFRCFCEDLFDYVTNWTDNTSLHGVRYLGERKRTICEKIWWIAVFVISITFCTIWINITFNKWMNSLTTLSTPIWQIPFPAVTICPETKCRQSIFNFTDLYLKDYDKFTAKEKTNFAYMSMLCNPREALQYMKLQPVDENIFIFFDEIISSFSNISFECSWNTEKFNCEHLFTKIFTDEGVCYTFNMLNRSELFSLDTVFFKDYLLHNKSSDDWTLEQGFTNDQKKAGDTYPRRTFFSGAANGLQIHMVVYDEDIDYVCNRDSLQGFKVLLHLPSEYPRFSQAYFRVPLNQAVLASIAPKMSKTSNDVKYYYSSDERGCFIRNERLLRFFKYYTQENCEIECLTTYTLGKCACVDFHMPREEHTQICGPDKIECMKKAKSEMLANEISYKLKGSKEDSGKIPGLRKCDCLPSCTSLSYSTETSQSDWDWMRSYKSLKGPYFYTPDLKSGRKLIHASKLAVFFKETEFIHLQRQEIFSFCDFLANCGGLLGLFTGFSFITLLETVYFLSIRWMCNIKRYGKKFWATPPA